MCPDWYCLWAGMSILSIWAGLLAWRSQSAWSAFHQRVRPWVLKYSYLYGSLELAEFPTSCDSCAGAGAVYFSLLLCPSSLVFLWVEASPFPISCGREHFMFRDSSLSSPALEKVVSLSRGVTGSSFAYLWGWWKSSRCLGLCCYPLWIWGVNISLVLAL